MTWEDLNEDNIKEVKERYINYIQENKDTKFRANMMTFEEFLETLSKCHRCENITDGEYYCECCHDDLFVV